MLRKIVLVIAVIFCLACSGFAVQKEARASDTIGVISAGKGAPTVPWLARFVMKENFFGVEEAMKYLHVQPSKKDLATLSEIPFTWDTLQELSKTHVLVAVFPLSIVDMQNLFKSSLFWDFRYSYDGKKPRFPSYATEKGTAQWWLIRKVPLVNPRVIAWQSPPKDYLFPEEQMPGARVMIYTMLGHYLATGERLYENTYILTADTHKDDRVQVGQFNEGIGSLTVTEVWRHIYDGAGNPYAQARKRD